MIFFCIYSVESISTKTIFFFKYQSEKEYLLADKYEISTTFFSLLSFNLGELKQIEIHPYLMLPKQVLQHSINFVACTDIITFLPETSAEKLC